MQLELRLRLRFMWTPHIHMYAIYWHVFLCCLLLAFEIRQRDMLRIRDQKCQQGCQSLEMSWQQFSDWLIGRRQSKSKLSCTHTRQRESYSEREWEWERERRRAGRQRKRKRMLQRAKRAKGNGNCNCQSLQANNVAQGQLATPSQRTRPSCNWQSKRVLCAKGRTKRGLQWQVGEVDKRQKCNQTQTLRGRGTAGAVPKEAAQCWQKCFGHFEDKRQSMATLHNA